MNHSLRTKMDNETRDHDDAYGKFPKEQKPADGIEEIVTEEMKYETFGLAEQPYHGERHIRNPKDLIKMRSEEVKIFVKGKVAAIGTVVNIGKDSFTIKTEDGELIERNYNNTGLEPLKNGRWVENNWVAIHKSGFMDREDRGA